MAERGKDLDTLIKKYRDVLKPMHEEFIEPTKAYADIIIPLGGENRKAIAMLQRYVKAILNEKKKL
jgi:uridine kinase